MKLFLAFILGSSLVFTSRGQALGSDSSSTKVREVMAKMNLDEKVGQLFLLGFQGQSLEAGIGKTISEIKPGGLIFFGRNIQTPRQTARLTYQAQIAAKEKYGIPLLVSVDQEGGVVSRIKLNPPMLSAMSIGEARDSDITTRMGYYTGLILKSLGFNMNLAPVVDLVGNKNSFIGNRTFSANKEVVEEMSSAFSTGLKFSGIIPTLKHFPGHGADFVDSHLMTPIRNNTYEEIWENDLKPYRQVHQHILPEAVMVAHIAFPKIDPTNTPATFSKVFLQKILRGDLNFRGIIVTDDIEMKGAGTNEPLNDRAVRALEAGADMIMIAWNRKAQKISHTSVINAVKSGRLSEKRIDESVERILLAKAELGLFENVPSPKLSVFKSLVRSNAVTDISAKVLEKLYARNIQRIGIKKTSVQYSSLHVYSSRPAFHDNFRKVYRRRFTPYALSQLKKTNIESLLTKNPKGIVLVHVSSPQVAKTVNSIAEKFKSRIYIVNGASPGLLNNSQAYRAVFDFFSADSRAANFVADYFTPDSPVNLQVENRLPSNTKDETVTDN